MNDLDTTLDADEAAFCDVAASLSGPVTDSLAVSTSALVFARGDRGDWSGDAADAFRSRMTSVLSSADDATDASARVAAGFQQFADSVGGARVRIDGIRERAAGAGLTLTQTSIVRPAQPPAPPDELTGAVTAAQVRAFDDARTARALALARQSAFADAAAEMESTRADLDHAEIDLDRVVSDVDALLIPALDFVTGAGIGVLIDEGVVAMRGQAAFLEAASARALATTTLPGAADFSGVFYSDLDRAAQLAAQSGAVADDAARLVRAGKAAGWVVGGVLTGVSIYNDIEAGESTTQAVVSNGGGFLASVGAGAAIGGMIGTVVPGPGNVVGVVVGSVVGGVVGIVTSGAIDSIFENGWDVGDAFENGWNDLRDSGAAVADLVAQGTGAVGSALAAAGDGLSDAWDAIFG